ncbi:hypothetical protein IAQ61_001921 [Plenodomus lingam]|uniref:Impact N-terminal domain-containing protein n=1 Tax=Leptosphaeria maculans (strain JN3 / isolate v23.1.3 / race Av1-4-5-6-7-8) TaxID=985895 RepID=E4ZGJ8_LEPMJ|nr:hypothetical protein LEMA_P065440.1 [Plenodomus lingam JN3]KAH9878649.1 hypothetical protein IAQ61_001921 [Plenodomus lingam]CBX90418.1 hypothetical protein LEMA_P065440.1 [Plenodomus lingam JN3]
MATKRSRSPSPPQNPSICLSSPIQEQTSRFIGVYSPSLPLKTLQALPDFRTATHIISAWRKPSRQKSLTPASKPLHDEGHDDGGESWAGKRLASVLRDTQTEGTVVVARWYGGQNIGPIRFTHIENCAKEAIYKFKTEQARAVQEAVRKKQKLEEEVRRKELVENLRERDYNIFALRTLLAQKKAKLADEVAVPLTPQRPQAYESMESEALRRVDKARDATIAFVLKEIDRVDEELKLVQDLVEDGKGEDKEEEKERLTTLI